jgi:hypothetical protein
MDKKLIELMRDMSTNPGASKEALQAAQRDLGLLFPPEYIDFMTESNGAEGSIGPSSYLVIWPVEEVATLNREYEVDRMLPGIFLFGSDGGETLYAFDTRAGNTSIVEVDPFEMDYESIKIRGQTLIEFLEHLHKET